MNKKEIEKRLEKLNKKAIITDDDIREIQYLEMQLERILDN